MTPDEVRSGISANPQDQAERARLINGAIENNMSEEIPGDWGIGVGGSPPEPTERAEYTDYVFRTQPNDIGLILYTDGTAAIFDATGGQINDNIYEFHPEEVWIDSTLRGLWDALEWAKDVSDSWEDFRRWMGDRAEDPTNLLMAWKIVHGDPDPNQRNITVGLTISGFVIVLFGEESTSMGHTFITSRYVEAAQGDIEDAIEAYQEEEWDV